MAVFVAVGCAQDGGVLDSYVELRVGKPYSDVNNITAERARQIARRLNWAARMVDHLNTVKQEKSK